MNVWGITDTGVIRPQNQDAYHIETDGPAGAFAVVCDGMGGAKAGNIASSLAVATFVDALRRIALNTFGQPNEALIEAISDANRAVCDRALADEDCNGMGTTLVTAWVWADAIHLANVGDSRAYLVTGDGIVKITRDHSLVEDLVLKGEITPEQARQHPKKNLITRALGAETQGEPDLYQIECRAGEFILLCSDGLSNVMTDQELLYEIVHGGPAGDCCGRLLNVALMRGAPDNVTAVLFEF